MKKIYYLFSFLIIYQIANSQTLRFALMGDIMLGTDYPQNYLPKSPDSLISPAIPYLKDADFVLGNLEGTIVSKEAIAKKCNNPKICYVFRSPEQYAETFKRVGFDGLNLANNHSNDMGELGREQTIRNLENLGIKTFGLEKHPIAVIEKNGVKVGIVGFAPNSGTLRITDYLNAKKWIDSLKKISDIVIVTFHGGAEGRAYSSVPKKTEYFVGENRGNVYEFAHKMIDYGADLVFGHGPHVPRGIETYKNKLIAYSLGNFCTYARFSLTGISGYAPLLLVDMDKESKNFIGGEIISFKQNGEGGLTFDSENQAFDLIKNLSNQDFKGHSINFVSPNKLEK
jgi:poly-gamma-glutamate capsule biosynthesis protein CapA/YwtB (metallophosphatase superfamily)